MAFCSECGAQAPDDKRFCSFCGKPRQIGTSGDQSELRKPGQPAEAIVPLSRFWGMGLVFLGATDALLLLARFMVLPKSKVEETSRFATDIILEASLGFLVAGWALTPRTQRGRLVMGYITLCGTLATIGYLFCELRHL